MHHVTATIRLLVKVPWPKILGVRSGYSPHHRFKHFDWVASGVHEYSDNNLHYPGETLTARIKFASWEHMRDKIAVGDNFDLLEVDRLIGHGTVDSVP